MPTNNPYTNNRYQNVFGAAQPIGSNYGNLFPANSNAPAPSGGSFDPNAGMLSSDVAAPAARGQNTMGSINNFIGSPTGQAAVGAVGAGLQAYQESKNNDQNRQMNGAQFAANLRQNQFNADRSDQMNRATGVLNADPLGADQHYAQHNALLSAILPNLRNFHSQPGDPGVAAAMGGPRGGFMNALGPNGLDPKMIAQKFGPEATAASIAQRHQEINSLDPNAAQPNFQALFGDTPDAAKNQQLVSGWAQQLQQKTGAEKAAYEQQMQHYIDQMVQQEQSQGGSGFWHKFAKVAAVVGAAAATYFTAGAASPLLGAAIGMGAGAAGAWGNGASGAGILTGAALGGVTGGIGGGAGGAVASTAGSAAKNIALNTATNPALYSAILNR
jgi:hypothetical protein